MAFHRIVRPCPRHRSRFRPRPALAATALALTAALAAGGCSLVEERKTVTSDVTVMEAVTAVELKDTRSGSVIVTPGDGPGVTIHRTVRYSGDTVPRPGHRVSGGVLTFSDGCDHDTCTIDYELKVPAAATVKLESSSGDLKVTGVAAAELRSSSGDVKADRITGPLKVRTSSGSITGTALGGPAAEARSGSGDVRLGFEKAPRSAEAETSSGDVGLTVPGGPYRVEASTGSGDRDISVPTDPGVAARLTVKTSSGDLRIASAA
ncbi:hypothetical protein DEJ50_15755 [Streptomyces venezuelae]|uniref:DUF4097 domain-containing protein n=1 Tax=Streptomyces venezuelae TaxID=54571 RepID=A0A5P2D1M2_STRVZ|nr:DUF4097 family beta strand repeat-containing protein [Streptomyces venezuelae]QES49044.1 hypothetical protein DEJ50_15755 [Streptomyces venezuelae]